MHHIFTPQLQGVLEWRDEWGPWMADVVAQNLLTSFSNMVAPQHASRTKNLDAGLPNDACSLLAMPPALYPGGIEEKLCVPWDKGLVEIAPGFPLLSVNNDGYLQVKLPRNKGQRSHRYEYVHRIIFCLLIGPIPHGLVLCHECENKRCMSINCIFSGKQGTVNIIRGKQNISNSPAWKAVREDRRQLVVLRNAERVHMLEEEEEKKQAVVEEERQVQRAKDKKNKRKGG